MLRFRAFVLVLMVAGVVPTTTAGRLAPPARKALDDFFRAFGKRWTIATTEKGYVSSITGVPNVAISPDGRELVPYVRKLGLAVAPQFSEGPDEEARFGPIRRYTYRQKTPADTPVENAEILVKRSDEGGPYDIILNLAQPVPVDPPDRLGAGGAKALVQSLFTLRNAAVLDSPRSAGARLLPESEAALRLEVADPPPPHLEAFDQQIRRVYEVVVLASMDTACGRETVLARQYTIDASTDDDRRRILRVSTLASDFVEGRGRVFEPNPVLSLRTEEFPEPGHLEGSFEDRPYQLRDLHGLAAARDGKYALQGKYAAVTELRCPLSVPDTVEAQDGVPDFSTARGGIQFAAVSAYYHIDSSARWVELLGYGDSVPSALPVDINGGKGSRVLAAYVPDSQVTSRHLWFGVHDRFDIFIAEDGELVAHEYGHAVLQHRTGKRFIIDNGVRGKNESRAVNEGFADYWALSSFALENAARRHVLDCLAEWAFSNSGPCLRRYPRKQHKKFINGNDDHPNGEIWSGALFRIFQATGMNRRVADAVILGGHFARFDKGDAPTMREMAEGIIIADAQKFRGAHKDAFCKVFKNQGIGPVACCAKKSACTASWRP